MVASNDYIQYIMETYGQAAAANRSTPGRRGNVIELQKELADEVLVTGDLHGNRLNFNQICRLAALDRNPRRHLVLQEVCHGGPLYPDSNGCMSHGILEDVAALKNKHPERVHFILGNHELAELTDFPIQKRRQLLNLQFWLGLKRMYGDAAEDVQDVSRVFLQTCPLAVRVAPNIFISHSIPGDLPAGDFDRTIFDRELTPEDYAGFGPVFQLVWGRDYRPENAKCFAEMVGNEILINGHEPCSEGFIAPNDFQIILDSSSDRPAYVMLPVGEKLCHEDIMGRTGRIG